MPGRRRRRGRADGARSRARNPSCATSRDTGERTVVSIFEPETHVLRSIDAMALRDPPPTIRGCHLYHGAATNRGAIMSTIWGQGARNAIIAVALGAVFAAGLGVAAGAESGAPYSAEPVPAPVSV